MSWMLTLIWRTWRAWRGCRHPGPPSSRAQHWVQSVRGAPLLRAGQATARHASWTATSPRSAAAQPAPPPCLHIGLPKALCSALAVCVSFAACCRPVGRPAAEKAGGVAACCKAATARGFSWPRRSLAAPLPNSLWRALHWPSARGAPRPSSLFMPRQAWLGAGLHVAFSTILCCCHRGQSASDKASHDEQGTGTRPAKGDMQRRQVVPPWNLAC